MTFREGASPSTWEAPAPSAAATTAPEIRSVRARWEYFCVVTMTPSESEDSTGTSPGVKRPGTSIVGQFDLPLPKSSRKPARVVADRGGGAARGAPATWGERGGGCARAG